MNTSGLNVPHYVNFSPEDSVFIKIFHFFDPDILIPRNSHVNDGDEGFGGLEDIVNLDVEIRKTKTKNILTLSDNIINLFDICCIVHRAFLPQIATATF